jgi:hypothetical protein
MSSSYVYDPYVIEFTSIDYEAGDYLSVDHNFGRTVNVQVYDDTGEEIFPEIKDMLDGNTVQIRFYEAGQLVKPSGKYIVS